MRRVVVALVVLALAGAGAFAKPTVTAGNGLLRIESAQTPGTGAWGVNLHFAGPVVGAYHMNDGNITTWDGILRLGLGWTPVRWLEVGVVPGMGYYKPTAASATTIGLWDTEANLKFSHTISDMLALGVQVRGLIPTGSADFFPVNYTNGFDVGGRALFTLDFTQSFPFRAHLNAGYMMTLDELAGNKASDYLPVGLGLEFPTRFITPMVEVYTQRPMDDLGTADIFASPGARLTLDNGFAVDLSWDFLVNKAAGDTREAFFHDITLGLSWSTPAKRHIPMGSIAGVVTDARTNAPIDAQISFPGSDLEAIPVAATGYRVNEIAPGMYTVQASATGYSSATKTAVVIDGEVSTVDFALKPMIAVLSGTVTDRESGKPLVATVSAPGAADAMTDAAGAYKIQLKPGTYSVEASADGYISQSMQVKADAGATATKDFRLVKKGMKIAFRGINFETAKATILPESYPILDEAARVLIDNPTIKVEVGGHTDARGSDAYNLRLSQQRAEAVVDYLATKHGVDRSRMVAKGYGERNPVAPNDSEENMYKNRRVEFTILEK